MEGSVSLLSSATGNPQICKFFLCIKHVCTTVELNCSPLVCLKLSVCDQCHLQSYCLLFFESSLYFVFVSVHFFVCICLCCLLSARAHGHRTSDAGMASPLSPAAPTAPTRAAKRAKYKAKSLAMKVKILNVLQAGASQKEVMEKFNEKENTLSTYVKN